MLSVAEQVRIAVVQHEESCPLGLFTGWFAEAGATVHTVRASEGEPLPPATDYDALVVLGGSMNAEDDERAPWLPAVRARLRDSVATGVATLGICMGHQLLGVALGGHSRPNPHGKAVGVLPIGRTEAPDALLDALPGDGVVVQWNDDVVSPAPPEAVVLARTADGEVQAARFGPAAWGVQWHPEVDTAILRVWAGEEPEGLIAAGIDAEARLADVDAHAGRLADSGRALAQRFVALAAIR